MGRKTAVKDHLGREFESVTQMCKTYRISTRLYYDRVSRGFSTKQALGFEKKQKNLYNNLEEVTVERGISKEQFEVGRSLGLNLHEIELLSKGKLCIDHTGSVHTSFNKLCQAWGQNTSTVRNRMKRGLTLEEALEKQRGE